MARGTPSRLEWLELFFDLSVVAAIGVLVRGLGHDPDLAGLGMLLVSYAAIWLVWISVVMYADLAGEQTHVRVVLLTMLLVAVMAAASPVHFEHRANAFAGAFLLSRVVIARWAFGTGRVLVSWPLLQFGGFTLPWIVSLWVDAPAKYWLWALGVGGDLAMALARSERSTSERLAQLQAAPARGRGGGKSFAGMENADVDQAHVDERLGLMMIIVLGEVVAELVVAASTSRWDRPFVSVAVAGFLIVIGLWQLTFSFGLAAAPGLRPAQMALRFALPLNLLSTLGIMLLAAGLGTMAEAPDQPVADTMRWIMCAGLALHFSVALVAGFAGGAPRRWVLGWSLPSVVYPLVLAAITADAPAARLSWLLFVAVAWQYVYTRPMARRLTAAPAA